MSAKFQLEVIASKDVILFLIWVHRDQESALEVCLLSAHPLVGICMCPFLLHLMVVLMAKVLMGK